MDVSQTREPGEEDTRDYVTILTHRNGRHYVALMRYSPRADTFEPVRSSFRIQSKTTVAQLARQWAKMYGVEFRP